VTTENRSSGRHGVVTGGRCVSFRSFKGYRGRGFSNPQGAGWFSSSLQERPISVVQINCDGSTTVDVVVTFRT